jgi:hypothetical protein
VTVVFTALLKTRAAAGPWIAVTYKLRGISSGRGAISAPDLGNGRRDLASGGQISLRAASLAQ